MRHGALVAVLVTALLLDGRAEPRQDSEGEAVAAMLAALEVALGSRDLAGFATAFAPALPADDLQTLHGLAGSDIQSAVVRQRAREGSFILAEAFTDYGRHGRLASWVIGIAPGRDGRRVEMVSLRELSSFDELIRLDLDDAEQFVIRDFALRGVDFELSMATGVAFAANTTGGITGLVLRGDGRVRFTPPDPTEQGQLAILADRSDFAADVDEAFIRVNPFEHADLIQSHMLETVPVNAELLRRARETFLGRADQSYRFDLGDLSSDRWSVRPPAGGMLVDFRAGRHGWLSYAVSPEQPEDISLFDRARNRRISTYASPDHLSRYGRFFADDVDENYDVLHTAVDLAFDPARRWLSGRAELQVGLRHPSSVIRLRLADSLAVASVSSPDLGPLLALRPAGLNTVIVGLPGDLPAGRTFRLDVQYHGRLAPQSLDREAWLVAGPVDQGEREPLSLSVEPRFLYSSRSGWYPQTESTRHATASIRLTFPSAYQAIATGRERANVVSDVADDRFGSRVRRVRTVEYRADKPIRYLAFLVTRLEPVGSTSVDVAPADAGRRTVEVTVRRSPVLTSRQRITTEGVAAVVSFFGRLIGGAPYPSLTVAVLEDAVPGGHSPAEFALINQPHPATPFSWANDPVAFPDAPDYFLAHEIAHQWWGQAVGARNYHEQWISEGFAQYMAWLYLESARGPSTARRLMVRMRETAEEYAAAGPIHLGNRVGHLRNDSRAFRAIVYNKSAVVLHMLRRLIGDEAFFAGLRRLYRAGEFTRIGTDDVERAFQAETSVRLRAFFRQWVLESGVPEVRPSWSDDSGQPVVRIEQTGPAFLFPLDLVLEYADGSEERVTVPITAATAEFRPAMHQALRRVTVDDELTIVRVVR